MEIKDSNSINGMAHRNELESPESGTPWGFVLPHGISPHSLAEIIIYQISMIVNQTGKIFASL